MDFSEKDEALAYEEFVNKYTSSYLKINNKYTIQLRAVTPTSLQTDKYSIPFDIIETIEPIMPRTGLWIVHDNLIYLFKYAKRQWIKGFAPKKTHNFTIVQQGSMPIGAEDILIFGEYLGEAAEFNGVLYLRWVCVAEIDHVQKRIISFKSKFNPEIEEIWNQRLGYSMVSKHRNQLDLNQTKKKIVF